MPGCPRSATRSDRQTIDQALLQLEPRVQSQLGWLLTLFEWGPPLFAVQLTTFTRMSTAEQDDYLAGWATSRMSARRLGIPRPQESVDARVLLAGRRPGRDSLRRPVGAAAAPSAD